MLWLASFVVKLILERLVKVKHGCIILKHRHAGEQLNRELESGSSIANELFATHLLASARQGW